MEVTKIIEKVYSKMPYSDQIEDLNISEVNAIRFTWRGDRFRVDEYFHVNQITGSEANGLMLTGSNMAIILQKLLKS